jgi:hypothetical protein
MVFSGTPEAEEYDKELERFEQWKGNGRPSYAATILVSRFKFAQQLLIVLGRNQSNK